MKRTLSAIGAFGLAACAVLAQSNQPPAAETKFYNLEFQVKEVEGGKVVNSRAYDMMVSNGNGQYSTRTGGRISYANPGNTGFNLMEVGVNIDCRNVKERNGQLNLGVSADVSSMMPPAEGVASPPSTRQNRWSSEVIVPLRKATIIFSSDDSQGKRKMQLELTATPIG